MNSRLEGVPQVPPLLRDLGILLDGGRAALATMARSLPVNVLLRLQPLHIILQIRFV